MIFISESGLLERGRKAAWDAWYLEHLHIMLTVPGITSAQRFETDLPDHAPSLAMYTVASPEVFTDPYYLSIRGFGPWDQAIDKRHYHRNLFAGLDRAPSVRDDQRLLVADRQRPDLEVPGVSFAWLECVGLDHTTPFRGITVVIADSVPALPSGVAVYAPVADPGS